MKEYMDSKNPNWEDGSDVFIEENKVCEGKDCANTFTVTWPGMRRCGRCRKNKVPYKLADEPF